MLNIQWAEPIVSDTKYTKVEIYISSREKTIIKSTIQVAVL